jgi:UDP-2-acetamido-2-deoxy-ribo-hexuluronate aminotransferase
MRFSRALGQSPTIRVPEVIAGARSVWAQYTLRVQERARLQATLKDLGIPSRVYYPAALPQQPAYRNYPSAPIPTSRALCAEVLSLPMHPYLSESEQQRIIEAVLQSAI